MSRDDVTLEEFEQIIADMKIKCPDTTEEKLREDGHFYFNIIDSPTLEDYVELESIRLNFLFVCAGNIQISLSFERWFKTNRPQCEVRSTGTSYGYPCQMTEGLVNWADKIFVMDLEQLMFIRRKFPDHEHKVEVVGCSDQYPNDSPQLIRLIEFWVEKRKL